MPAQAVEPVPEELLLLLLLATAFVPVAFPLAAELRKAASFLSAVALVPDVFQSMAALVLVIRQVQFVAPPGQGLPEFSL